MPNFLIIARREYLERVKTRSFIVMTVLLPVILVGGTVLPSLLMTRASGASKHFVVVVSNSAMGEILSNQLKNISHKPESKTAQQGNGGFGQAETKLNLVVDVSTDTSAAQHVALTDRVKQKQLDGVIFATDDALAERKVIFYTRDISSFSIHQLVTDRMTESVRRGFLASKGLTQPEIDTALKSVEVEAQGPTGTGNPTVVFFTVFSLVMIMYAAVLLYGISVLRAILEEKTSRVMEVMLASARPIEMMAGKILGVGAVGLTQIGIWSVAAVLYGSLSIAQAGIDIKGLLSAKLMLFLGVFFLIGYALYSTLCAAVGAMVNSEQEAQQLQFVIMFPLIISVAIMASVLQSPNGPLAVWASLFPLSAPLVMFLRIAVQTPPWWQISLSIGLIIASTVALMFLCERIYRVGILMYGKRPTLPEIVKWIKYA